MQPRPWHVFIWPALPVLGLVAGNIEIPPGSAVRSIVLCVGATLAGWVPVARLLGDWRKAALIVSLLALLFLSWTDLPRLTRAAGIPRALPVTPITTLVVLVLSGLIARLRTVVMLTRFANAFAVLSAAMIAWPIAAYQVERWRSPTHLPDAIPFQSADAAGRPDIYIIVLDAFGRADVLRDYYQIESPLAADLTDLGFDVADRATANYPQTAQSLAASLNVDYLPALLASQDDQLSPRQRYADLIGDSRVFRTLDAAGYRIRAYESQYAMVNPANVDSRPGPTLSITDFEFGLFRQTMAPRLSQLAGLPQGVLPAALHRRHILWTLDELATNLPAAGDPPTLVFAHLLIPHPPFTFEPDGSAYESDLPLGLADGDHWADVARASKSDEKYTDGYARAVRYASARIRDIAERVVRRTDGRRTIVYIQGDHGPGSLLDWDDHAKSDLRERLGILLAARFPAPKRMGLYDTITPINAMRVLLNNAVGTNLDLLGDRSFFSTFRQPGTFTDVTDAVRDDSQ